MHAKVRFWGVHVKTCIRYFDPLTRQWISMQLASPALHETHFSGKARKYFAEIPKLRNPSCCSGWGREGKEGRGASQWKTAASCHCCKVTLGLFMASAEGRAGAAAYIHPPPSKSESKTEFQLIEGKMSGNQNWIKSSALDHYWHSICGLVSFGNHRVGGIFPVATCTSLEKPLEKIKE